MHIELCRSLRPMRAMACGGALAMLVTALPSEVSWAKGAVGGVKRSPDEVIDVSLGAIEGPVLQPIWIPPGTPRGIPALPPYKQEPPAA